MTLVNMKLLVSKWTRFSLKQEGVKCTLAIANDGAIAESTISGVKKGGYGTKIMDAVICELLDGAWKISAFPNGEVRVTLTWRLPYS
jgi:two-component sensor histidine kinase